MGKLIYKKWVKRVLVLLQTAAAGVLVYCVLNLGFWMEDSYSLTELSIGYEETELFFRQVSTIVENKIRGEQNRVLFETDGELDMMKGIDIQSYGAVGNSVQDMNTTYTLDRSQYGSRRPVGAAGIFSGNNQSGNGDSAF